MKASTWPSTPPATSTADGSRQPVGRVFARWLAVAALSAVLTACTSVKLGYENLPWLLSWQADRYLDLDKAQEAVLDRHVETLQAWHRKSQLPIYASTITRIEEEIRAPVTPAQVADWRERLLATWPGVADRVAPVVAEIGVTLRPEQIAHLRRAFDKSNAKFVAENRPADPAARIELRAKRLAERAEGFLGRLDDAQRERVREAARRMAAGDDAWWAQRLARQRQMVELLDALSRERPAPDVALARATQALQALFAPQTVAVSPESDRLTSDLLASATPDQLRRAQSRVAQYRGDFVTLSQR